jgi:two-component system sensor histidine kinase UhpB
VTELGLDRAVQDLVKFWRDRRAEIAFSVELNDTEAGISDTLKDTAFRILQEAVNNAVRHAAPSCVGIWMSRERGCLVVKVENDGVGPAPAQAGPGFGLIGMRERVASVGGDLEVGRADKSQVWSVVATLPLAVETTLQAGARAV